MKIEDYLHLYLGCDTNHGKLVGINRNICFMLSQNREINPANLSEQSQTIKPIFRNLADFLSVSEKGSKLSL